LRQDLNRLKAPEGYLFAGAPRYKTLFGRDSLISAWQLIPTDPSIALATLRILASYQGRANDARSEEEPGKILHEHRFDVASQAEQPNWKFPYYGSVDSTLLFLIVAWEYVHQTGDVRMVTDLWPAIVSAYRWVLAQSDLDRDGFIAYQRKNPHGLFHQGWKDGSEDHLRIQPPVALVEVQGYAYAAHRAFASLAKTHGESDSAAAAAELAERLRGRLNEVFWMQDRGFFGLGLDGSKQLRRAVTSNPGHLLVCGAVEQRRIDSTIARFFRDDLWTAYGVRTHATSEPDFDPRSYHRGSIWPHDNWFLYRGLLAAGRKDEANRIREALLNAYRELGRIPELYAVVDAELVDLSTGPPGATVRANPLQAWASAGLLDMVYREQQWNPTL
jgi:glycogen debranching enzyme